MKLSKLTVVLTCLCLGTAPAVAANCGASSCSVGELVRISSSRADMPLACPTQALSDYIAFIFGLAEFQASMGVVMPKNPQQIEDRLQGESAEIDKAYKEAAGVASVAEGFSACSLAKKGERVILLKLPDPESTSMSAKVSPAKGGVPFWIAAVELDKVN